MSTSHLHQYAHVLVAYDGSTAATAALQWARVLTRRLVARLTIVIVQEPGQPPTRLAPLSQPPARAGLREVHVVTNGTPWRRLLIEASARDVDLIVIGKRGDSQQTARRVGRNSARVATRALVPTLLVPRGSEVPAETPHILLATDLLGGIAHGAAGIAMLAKALSATVEVLHVNVPMEQQALPFSGRPPAGEINDARVERELEALLQQLTARASLATGVRISARLRSASSVSACIAREAHAAADMLVLGTRPHRAFGVAWLGALTTKVLREVQRPLLLLPPELPSESAQPSAAVLDGQRGGGVHGHRHYEPSPGSRRRRDF